MIDVSQIKYTGTLVLPDTSQLDLTNLIESMDWEENKMELAMRMNLSLSNLEQDGLMLSERIQLGCYIVVMVSCGEYREEVARGIITDVSIHTSNSKNSLKITCYDELYSFQQSQDYVYYAAGIGTRFVITDILNNWKVPIEKYEGPNIIHAKLVYKSQNISDILLDILEDAEKKGAIKCLFRSSKGKISVLPLGSNNVVYHFSEDNVTSVELKTSTSDMITRVKVIGQEDNEGRVSVEALVDGNIEFGIRQRIYTRPKDDSIEAAKEAANQILKEKGNAQNDITVESPDIPFIRKGDKVHITGGVLNGFFYIVGIRHDISGMMSMNLDPVVTTEITEVQESVNQVKEFHKGDQVILNGAVYLDSYGSGKGKTFHNHTCTITIKVDISRPCPYHVDGIGWVYPNTINIV